MKVTFVLFEVISDLPRFTYLIIPTYPYILIFFLIPINSVIINYILYYIEANFCNSILSEIKKKTILIWFT